MMTDPILRPLILEAVVRKVVEDEMTARTERIWNKLKARMESGEYLEKVAVDQESGEMDLGKLQLKVNEDIEESTLEDLDQDEEDEIDEPEHDELDPEDFGEGKHSLAEIVPVALDQGPLVEDFEDAVHDLERRYTNNAEQAAGFELGAFHAIASSQLRAPMGRGYFRKSNIGRLRQIAEEYGYALRIQKCPIPSRVLIVFNDIRGSAGAQH